MIYRKPAAVEAEALLRKHYAVSFQDIGLSDDEWLSAYGDLEPSEAVSEHAEKYDLIPLDVLN